LQSLALLLPLHPSLLLFRRPLLISRGPLRLGLFAVESSLHSPSRPHSFLWQNNFPDYRPAFAAQLNVDGLSRLESEPLTVRIVALHQSPGAHHDLTADP